MEAQEIKRNRILDAAVTLFSQNGYSVTHVADIAAACGMGKSTFYDYFKSKEDLLFEMLRDRIINPYKELPSQLEQPGLRAKDKLSLFLQFEAAISQQMGSSKNHMEFFQTKSDIVKQEDFLQVIQQFIKLRFSIILHILEEGMASGEFRNVEPLMATTYIMSAPIFMHELCSDSSVVFESRFSKGKVLTSEERQRTFLDLILNGISSDTTK